MLFCFLLKMEESWSPLQPGLNWTLVLQATLCVPMQLSKVSKMAWLRDDTSIRFAAYGGAFSYNRPAWFTPPSYHPVSETPCGAQMAKKKRWEIREPGRHLQRWPGPTLLREAAVSKLHWVLHVFVKLSLDHIWVWKLHSFSGSHSSFWPPSLWNMFALHLVMFPLLQLCLLLLITKHLSLFMCRKLIGPSRANCTQEWPSFQLP